MNISRLTLYLCYCRKISAKNVRRIISSISDSDNITTDKIYTYRSKAVYEEINKAEETLMKHNIKYITYGDDNYPYRFTRPLIENTLFNEKTLPDYPPLLFYRGNINILNSCKVCSVIGTRKPEARALYYEKKLIKNLLKNNKIIVSGLANGCDITAHEACIKSGGKTAAIIGTDICLISGERKKTADKIVSEGGCIISEYGPGITTFKYHFIRRDRLLALCSDEIYLIQSSICGGSMHTVRSAINYRKKIYALSVCENSSADSYSGNTLLINSGKADPLLPRML